ncbi:intraflagellar transport protein 43-domain-containing protein [Chytriomyces sp. MP71]|nr:intraflagellar transport protein 43-domain-containing protein [Chytriomyces sp. MP71]
MSQSIPTILSRQQRERNMDLTDETHQPGSIRDSTASNPTNPAPPKGRRVRAPFRSASGPADDPTVSDIRNTAAPKAPDADDDDDSGPMSPAMKMMDENGLPPGVAAPSVSLGASGRPKKTSSSRFDREPPPKAGGKSGWGEESQIAVGDAKQGRRSLAGRRDKAAAAEESRKSLADREREENEDVEDEEDGDESDDEDPRASRVKESKRNLRGGRDEVIMIIPDLNDVEEDEMITTVAAPPSLKVNKVKTIRELDNELAISTGMLNDQSGVDGIDFTLLTTYALCPPDMVYEEDRHWDWDVTFTEITTADEGISV